MPPAATPPRVDGHASEGHLWLIATAKFTAWWLSQLGVIFALSDAGAVVIASALTGLFGVLNVALTIWWASREKRAHTSRSAEYRRAGGNTTRRRRAGDNTSDDFRGKRKH